MPEEKTSTNTKPIRASGNIRKSYIAENVDSSKSSSSDSNLLEKAVKIFKDVHSKTKKKLQQMK